MRLEGGTCTRVSRASFLLQITNLKTLLNLEVEVRQSTYEITMQSKDKHFDCKRCNPVTRAKKQSKQFCAEGFTANSFLIMHIRRHCALLAICKPRTSVHSRCLSMQGVPFHDEIALQLSNMPASDSVELGNRSGVVNVALR